MSSCAVAQHNKASQTLFTQQEMREMRKAIGKYSVSKSYGHQKFTWGKKGGLTCGFKPIFSNYAQSQEWNQYSKLFLHFPLNEENLSWMELNPSLW